MRYLPRLIEPELLEYLKYFSVVSVTGPRQSGKSTLLRQLLPDYRYVNFDDINQLKLFEDDPEAFMTLYDDKVIFDEAQKCPDLFNAIKIAVDNDRDNKGKYVLSGSSQFTLLEKITESLAGRIGLLTLLPFQYAEIPAGDREQSFLFGCYPELIDRHFAKADAWYGSYLTTYLERDVRNIANIGDLSLFQRFIYLLAANVAQELNMSRYANELGVAVSTIKRWISILEASYIIFRLPPYFKNFGKRMTKAPKIYFHDIGLVNHLMGIDQTEHLQKGPLAGALFENYIISDTLKKQFNFVTQNKLYYLRLNNHNEIDLLLDHRRHIDFIEIKRNSTAAPKMAKNIHFMLELNDNKTDHGMVVYQGENRAIHKHIDFINYEEFLLRKPT